MRSILPPFSSILILKNRHLLSLLEVVLWKVESIYFSNYSCYCCVSSLSPLLNHPDFFFFSSISRIVLIFRLIGPKAHNFSSDYSIFSKISYSLWSNLLELLAWTAPCWMSMLYEMKSSNSSLRMHLSSSVILIFDFFTIDFTIISFCIIFFLAKSIICWSWSLCSSNFIGSRPTSSS